MEKFKGLYLDFIIYPMQRKMINNHPFIEYKHAHKEEKEMLACSLRFYHTMNKRRSIRAFSDKPIDKQIIENIIRTASTAPSGAHKQPWTFCIVSDPVLKQKIRFAAEEEERISYGGRMSKEWLKDLEPLGTDSQKPFLEIAPYLIIVFKRSYEYTPEGKKHQNYYVQESVGLACGFLIAAIHQAGLCTLTHTPSPMNFLSKILNRPENEKPFLLLPVGYPANEVFVPDIHRKPLEQVAEFYEALES